MFTPQEKSFMTRALIESIDLEKVQDFEKTIVEKSLEILEEHIQKDEHEYNQDELEIISIATFIEQQYRED